MASDGLVYVDLNVGPPAPTPRPAIAGVDVNVGPPPSPPSSAFASIDLDVQEVILPDPGPGKDHPSTVLYDSPVVYYRLGDPANSTVLKDYSGNGRDGSYSGPIHPVPGLLPGDTDGAARFSGGQRTVTNYAAWMNLPKYTLECIFKPSSIATMAWIDRDYESRTFQFRMESSGKAGFIAWNSGGTLVAIAGTTVMQVGRTYHVVATYDQTNIKLYVNGVLEATAALAGPANTGTSRLQLGTNNAGYGYLNGDLDEAAIYPGAFTASRVASHYKSSTTAPVTKIDVPVGQATETDVARPITTVIVPPPKPAIGVAAETDLAQPLTVKIPPRVPISPASEQDVALPITMKIAGLVYPITVSLGQAMEVNLSQRLAVAGDANPAGEPGETQDSAVEIAGLPGQVYVDKFYPAQWYVWEAPAEIDFARFYAANTQIEIWNDSGLLASSDAGDVRFAVVPATIYTIRVAGTIETTLYWIDGSPSDYNNFDDPMVIDSIYGSDEISLLNNDAESVAPAGATATGWATFVADNTNTLNLNLTPDNDVNYTVTVYSGTSLDNLTPVATGSGTVPVDVVEGQQYYVQVSASNDRVNFEMSWNTAPVIVPPEEPFEYLRAFVYKPNGTTMITEVPQRMGVTFQEPLNVAGAGSLSVRMDSDVLDAYPDLFEWRNIVKFFLGNKCVHGFRIQRRNTTFVSTDEWKGYVKEVSGPSVQHILDDFIVKHDGPVRPDSGTSRIYGWASLRDEWYNPTKWRAPITSSPRSDPPGDWNEEPKKRSKWKQPEKWPDETARWIYRGANVTGRRTGRMHFRKTFYIGEMQHVRIFAAGDERIRVFMDGEEVISTDSVETGYTDMSVVDMVLSKGPHTVALYARGLYSLGGDGNDAAIFTMMKVNKKGKPTDVVLNSDESWEANFSYPPPAWNRAMVIRNCIKEAKARGNSSAQMLTVGFSATRDSEGRLWRDRWDEEVEIGTSCLGLQEKLSEGNNFDVWVNPDNFHIEAYRRRGVDKSHSITLEPGRNLIDWSIEEVEEARNDFYIQYDGGWTSYSVASSKKTYGDREAFISLGNSKDDKDAKRTMRGVASGVASAIKRAGTSEVRTQKEGTPAGGLVAVPGARPFLDYGVGDTVKAPNLNGVLKPHRILGLTCTESEDGTLSYDPELEEIR